MKHDFSATWLPGLFGEGTARRVAVVFNGDGPANILVDGETGQTVHLVINSSVVSDDADAAIPAPVSMSAVPVVA